MSFSKQYSPCLQEDLARTFDQLASIPKEKFQGKVFLLTGCAGFLGYYFLRFFQFMGEELNIRKVIALDNFMFGEPPWMRSIREDSRFVLRKFDIIHDRIDSIPEAAEADYVIHMASIASPVFYRKHPIETLDANVWGLRALFDFYRDKDLSGLLFFSSSELYGNPDAAHIPTSEDYYGYVCATGPRSCYDEAKRFGETLCMLYAQCYDLPVRVVRPFNNYGPGMRLGDKRVPADFALNIYRNEDITILSSGTPTRTFCYISDAVAGYFKVLMHHKYDFFNIGTEKPEITIGQLAEIYRRHGEELFGYKGTVRYGSSTDSQYLTNNPQRRCPDITKARTLLQYEPLIPVEEGVRRFLTFIRESGEEEFLW